MTASFANSGSDYRCRAEPIVVASFMRSGTHLTMDFVRRNFAGVGAWKLPGERIDNLYLPIDCLADGTWSKARVRKVIHRSPVLLGKVHWTDPEFHMIRQSAFSQIGDWLSEQSRIILTHRHPKKTIDSLIVWKYFTGELKAPVIPSDEWLAKRVEEWKGRIEGWSKTSRPVYLLSADRLLRQPQHVRSELERFLGLESIARDRLLPRQLRGKWHYRLNRLTRIRPESTEILTMRPAPKVSWKDNHRQVIEDIAGELTTRLGYQIGSLRE